MATKLKRSLGLLEATFAGIGIIVGAGIYALMGKAAGIAGNSVWISFAIASLVAAFTGMSYAELSHKYPNDAGEYVYAEKAFNRKWGWLVAWLIIAQGVISTAAVALGFAGYFNSLFQIPTTYIYMVVIAIGIIAVFTFVNFWGVKESAHLNIFFTIFEVGGLVAIIVFGLKYIGKVNYLESANGFPGVMSAAALVFFAYIGFESIVKLSEETKNPRVTIPRALIIAIVVSTILYILTAIAAVSVLGWRQLGASHAPLADVAASAFGPKAYLILAIIALFSTANTILIIMLTTSRIMYGMGDDYKKLKWWSVVHKSRKTPWLSVLAVGAVSALFVIPGNITLVAEITNFAIFFTFAVINAAVIMLRYKNRHKAKVCEGFCVPSIGWFPVLSLLGLVVSVVMLFSLSWQVIAGGIVLTLIGVGVYYYIRNNKRE